MLKAEKYRKMRFFLSRISPLFFLRLNSDKWTKIVQRKTNVINVVSEMLRTSEALSKVECLHRPHPHTRRPQCETVASSLKYNSRFILIELSKLGCVAVCRVFKCQTPCGMSTLLRGDCITDGDVRFVWVFFCLLECRISQLRNVNSAICCQNWAIRCWRTIFAQTLLWSGSQVSINPSQYTKNMWNIEQVEYLKYYPGCDKIPQQSQNGNYDCVLCLGKCCRWWWKIGKNNVRSCNWDLVRNLNTSRTSSIWQQTQT